MLVSSCLGCSMPAVKHLLAQDSQIMSSLIRRSRTLLSALLANYMARRMVTTLEKALMRQNQAHKEYNTLKLLATHTHLGSA